MAEVPAHRSGANHDATMDLVVGIVAAYVGHNTIASNGLPALIASVHAALIGIGTPGPEVVPQEPAVPVRGSVKPDSIACLECGKRFKSLKRHLRTSHDLRPTEYKAKWGLRSDYPMTAATSAEIRSKLAKAIGLGQKRAR
jgi:predicted transcriptional regulator